MSSKIVSVALIVLLGTLCVLSVDASADGDDRASFGEWVVFVIVVGGMLAVLIVGAILQRREMNPHTGRPRKIRIGRARGPLRKMK